MLRPTLSGALSTARRFDYIPYLFRLAAYAWRNYLKPRARRLLGRVIPLAVVAGMSYWLAGQVQTTEPVKVIIKLFSLFVLVVITARIQLALVALVFLSCTIVYPNAIPRPFGASGFGFGELLVLFTVFIAFLQAYKSKRHVSSSISFPLFLFFVSALVGLIIDYRAYLANPRGFYSFSDVYNVGRPVFFYLFFFGLLFGIKDKRTCRFVFYSVLAMACLVAVTISAQYIIGRGTSLFLGYSEESLIGQVTEAGDDRVTRIQPPGLAITLLMFPTAMCLAAYHKGKTGRLFAVAATLLAAALVFTFGRNYWITSVVAIAGMMVMLPGRVRLRMLSLVVTVTLVGGLFVAGIAGVSPGRGASLWKAISGRALSIVAIKETMNTSSLMNRRRENRGVLKLVKDSPVFGVGLGSSLKHEYLLVRTAHGWSHVATSTNIVHNSYLEMWAHYGLMGLISFAWISVVFVIHCLRLWKHGADLWMRCMGLSFMFAYFGLLFRAFVGMTLLRQQWEIVAAALMWGMVEVAFFLSKQEPASQSNMHLSAERMLAGQLPGHVPRAEPSAAL